MTYEETRIVLNVLFVAYPNSYKGWEKGHRDAAKKLWLGMFSHIPYEIVMKAVKQEIAENRTNFAPSVGQIMFRVKELISVYDADTAWSEVCYIVRTVDFENIPAAVKTLDDISREIVTSRDIQRMKDTPGAMDKEKPRFYAMYAKLKDKKESAAVDSGDLMSISSKERMLQISSYKAPDLQIEMDQESEDKQ